MIQQHDISAVGKFQKTHALKGELNALLDIDSDYLTAGNALIVDVDGIYVPFYVSSVRPKGTASYLIKLDGIDSEEEARQFVNKEIYALKSELAPFLDVDEEELLDEDDLVGYRVEDASTGREVGTIDAIDSATDNLLFIIATDDGEEVYVPAVDDFIVEVDDDSRVIKMNFPAGLLDLNRKTDKKD